MRAAYADPPYPGQAKRHYAAHPDFAGEVDHPALIAQLADTFDAWALSTSSPALRDLLPLTPPGTRIAAWVKPFAVWKPSVRVAYAWEPVLFYAPDSSHGNRGVDWLSASCVFKSEGPGPNTKGSKPLEVCAWLFDLLGMLPDDDFTDLFPGSGAVGAAWEWWKRQPRLFMRERPLEARRAFPQLAFDDAGLAREDSRIHTATCRE